MKIQNINRKPIYNNVKALYSILESIRLVILLFTVVKVLGFYDYFRNDITFFLFGKHNNDYSSFYNEDVENINKSYKFFYSFEILLILVKIFLGIFVLVKINSTIQLFRQISSQNNDNL